MPATQYYIVATVGGEVKFLSFDSTAKITRTLSGSATSFALEDGYEVSDNYVNKNQKISMSGVISDIKSTAMQADMYVNRGTADYLRSMEKLKDSGIPFSIHTPATDNQIILDNCVFETLQISQDTRHGSTVNNNSYAMSFTAKQIRFGKSAVVRKKRGKIVEEKVKPKAKVTARKVPIDPDAKSLYIERPLDGSDNEEDVVISHTQYKKFVDDGDSARWVKMELDQVKTYRESKLSETAKISNSKLAAHEKISGLGK